MENFEKLGSFYLGKKFNTKNKEVLDEAVMYDSKDLSTHAVCVGMTGSGKTGLCISMLEEAVIDNIPTIIIDPKGDMTNLLLTFPDLRPEDFKPWINETEAQAKGVSLDEYAEKQASLWKSGLEKWGQSGDRIKKFKDNAEFAVYTPGSTSGIPISILSSFNAPSDKVREDPDIYSESIGSTTTGLLGLLGINADPLKSREHILISNILKFHWDDGKDLDLAGLIQSIQSPPISRIGAFDIETFYPSKDRFELAISLNNLLSAPGFQNWFAGEPLSVDRFLYSENVKPRVSIFYIAHLNDNERMFFVSMLLNQIINWMRKQTGTGSLRAILYFDEIFGYLPPVANPPSKKPLMLLLKQARAFGLGLVLATQNPVDLDYKALSNIGTWLIGRLQTERDRLRVLDGLEGATAESGGTLNRSDIDNIITNLDKRVFLLHNVHEDHPVVFHTRWVLSYLAGPLTRIQVKELMKNSDADYASGSESQRISAPEKDFAKPSVPPDVDQYYIPVRGAFVEDAKLFYKPCLFGSAEINFVDPKTKSVLSEPVVSLYPISPGPIPIKWDTPVEAEIYSHDLTKECEEYSDYEQLADDAFDSKNFTKWSRDFEDHLYRNQFIELFTSPRFKLTSSPNESERDFRIRVAQLAREERDEITAKLREKYARKTASIESKIRTAEDRIAREEAQSKQQKLQTAINIGATLLGAFLGRKAVSSSTVSKTGTSIRSASKAMKEAQDVERAKQNLEFLNQQLLDLDKEFQNEVDLLTEKFDPLTEVFETKQLRPRKSDINVKLTCLVWLPYWKLGDSTLQKAWG